MSRPFTFPSRKKNDPVFDDFISDNQLSLIDMQRSLSTFALTSVPSSSSAAGKPGMFAYDSSYLYVCVDDDTWARVAISTW